jgi:drug/metabolite transporter (DMT)-like permease
MNFIWPLFFLLDYLTEGIHFMTILSTRTMTLTAFALLAFAGNSVLCRLALVDNAIDEFSFTILRLLSGALVLSLLMFYRRFSMKTGSNNGSENGNAKKIPLTQAGSWWGGMLLFIYAIFFSVAYVRVDTGVGALILFGTVQVTMILSAFLKGKRLSIMEWLGVLLAVVGVGYLLWPEEGSGVAAISWWGAAMMIVSGVAWGLYSLHGALSRDALADTTSNFLRAIPMVAGLLIVFVFQAPVLSLSGIVLAFASGALMSGVGYAIWYAVLPSLSSIQAAVMQLLVPILAAIGGVLFAHEQITIDLFVSSIMVLGGILLVVLFRPRT